MTVIRWLCIGMVAGLLAGGSLILGSVSEAEASETTVVDLVFDVRPNPPRFLGTGTEIDWEMPGLTLELLRLVEKKAGVTFNFKRVPWQRAIYLIQTGEADGIFHASFKRKRMEFGVYPMKGDEPDPSRAVFNQSYVIYKRKDSPVTWDGKAFANLDGPVGANIGYSVIDDLRKIGVTVAEGRHQEINLDKLIKGRIQAFAELEGMTDLYLRRYPERYRDVVKLSPPFRTKPYYLLFSKPFHAKDPALANRIWDAIAEVSASDEFTAIIERYGGS